MRTTVRLSGDLLLRAKSKAAAEGRTLTSLLEEGLRVVLSDSRRPQARSPATEMPISKRAGGLAPGINPDKISTQTEEMDDIERMQRLDAQFRADYGDNAPK